MSTSLQSHVQGQYQRLEAGVERLQKELAIAEAEATMPRTPEQEEEITSYASQIALSRAQMDELAQKF